LESSLPKAVALEARSLEGPAGAIPLIVMHGLLGSSRNWQAHGKALARARAVHILDLRNHGASPWSEVMDYPSMAADVIAFADAHGLERVHLLGHSMGGKVAMAVALTVPDRVVSAVVADIAPVAYSHDFEKEIGALRALDLATIDRRATADAALAAVLENAGVRQFLLQNLDFDAAGKAYWKPNLAVLDRSVATLTGWPDAYAGRSYEGPVLAIHGGASPYVDAAGEAAFRRIMPAVAFETLEGAGHWLHAEQPRPFLEAVQRFLST
jgi:pimeloyl-ACP methyl ester carboxylesterase